MTAISNALGSTRQQYYKMLTQLEGYYGKLSVYVDQLLQELRGSKSMRQGSAHAVLAFQANLNLYLQAQARYHERDPDPKALDGIHTELYRALHRDYQHEYRTFTNVRGIPPDIYAMRDWLDYLQKTLADGR